MSKALPLVANDIWKTFPGSRVPTIQGISLTLQPGEILTLLGPSGCGKTTILRMIAGFERPDDGEVWIGGAKVAGGRTWVPPEKRGVGMVFQDYALFPHLTVAENVAFGLRGRQSRDREKRVRSALGLVGLEGLGDRYPHNLSGGQQQRVALARALAPQPALTLLDEPFSNLDAALRVQMRDEVRRILKSQGSAAIFVTHDQKDALAISDRIAVINQGRVEQLAPPREIYQFPATPFVATFVGQTNLLNGVLQRGRIETEFGPVPCHHQRGQPEGSRVTVSVRPDSFEIAPDGPFTGRVESMIYGGNYVELQVTLLTQHGKGKQVWIHAHPEMPITEGQTVRFEARPDFVAVVEAGEAAVAGRPSD